MPRVAENGDDGLAWPAFLSEADGAGDVDSAGKTEEQTFFAQKLVDDGQSGLVLNPIGLINRDAFNVFRHPRLPNAFGERIAVIGIGVAVGEPRPHGSAIGIGAHSGNLWILLLQVKRRASECPAGADSSDKGADLSFSLFPDFWSGAAVMGLTIGSVVELVCPEPATLLSQPSRDVIVVFRIAVRLFWHGDDFGAKRAQETYFFRRLSFGNDDHCSVT